jgi:hypothetical protein
MTGARGLTLEFPAAYSVQQWRFYGGAYRALAPRTKFCPPQEISGLIMLN